MGADESPPVVIALGSNIEPEANLRRAVEGLGEWLRIAAASPVYRTPPWGLADQPDFLNAVVAGETALSPEETLERLLAQEARQGRTRPFPNAPRTIDLDLLFYGDRVFDTPRLTLPHPRLHERAFVLVPLCDLLPDRVHPRLGGTMAEWLNRTDTGGIVRTACTLAPPESVAHPGA